MRDDMLRKRERDAIFRKLQKELKERKDSETKTKSMKMYFSHKDHRAVADES